MKIPLYIVSLTGGVALFISQFCYINITGSLPYGLYVKTHQPIKTGSIVVFRPNIKQYPFVAKYIKPGLPLMKKVSALPGQVYNLPLTSKADSKGNPIIPWTPTTSTVPDNHLFVLGVTKYSLDSRYLGFIPQTSVIHHVRPLLTW